MVLQNRVIVLQRVFLLQVPVEAGGHDGGASAESAAAALEAVVLAEELVVPQRVLVARHQLLLARRALEALEVENLVLRPHHIVVLAEGSQTLVALGTK